MSAIEEIEAQGTLQPGRGVMLTFTAVAVAAASAIADDPYYFYTPPTPKRYTASLSYWEVTTELIEKRNEEIAETLYHEREQARGELAYCPETMPCCECAQLDLPNDAPPILEDQWGHMYVERTVVALGPAINRADPTQTYRLSCGHLAF